MANRRQRFHGLKLMSILVAVFPLTSTVPRLPTVPLELPPEHGTAAIRRRREVTPAEL